MIRKQILTRLGIAALTVVVLFVGWAIVVARLDFGLATERRAFDAAEWRSWGGERSCDGESPRLGMVADLRRNHLKLGIRKAAILRLLGPPDGHPFPPSLEYGLGGIIDCEFLSLELNRGGKLRSIVHYQG